MYVKTQLYTAHFNSKLKWATTLFQSSSHYLKLTPEKYVIETQKNKNNSIKNIQNILDKYNKNDSKTFLEKTKEYNIFIEYPELDKNYDKFIDSCEKSILKNDNYLLPSKFKNEFFSNTNDNQAFILINNKCNHLIVIKYQPNN